MTVLNYGDNTTDRSLASSAVSGGTSTGASSFVDSANMVNCGVCGQDFDYYGSAYTPYCSHRCSSDAVKREEARRKRQAAGQ